MACVFALNCPATAIAFCCHCSALRIVNYCAVHSTEMHTPSDKTSFTRNSTHMRSYTCSATHAQKSARCTLICALTHLPTLMRAQSIVLTHTVTHTHIIHIGTRRYTFLQRAATWLLCHCVAMPLLMPQGHRLHTCKHSNAANKQTRTDSSTRNSHSTRCNIPCHKLRYANTDIAIHINRNTHVNTAMHIWAHLHRRTSCSMHTETHIHGRMQQCCMRMSPDMCMPTRL